MYNVYIYPGLASTRVGLYMGPGAEKLNGTEPFLTCLFVLQKIKFVRKIINKFARLRFSDSNCTDINIFYSLEVVGRSSETQLQVGKN